MRNKKNTISVTDLASYAADTTAFIKYKKNGISTVQKQIGDDFHNSLHSPQRSNRVIYVLLAIIIVIFIVYNFIVPDNFFIF